MNREIKFRAWDKKNLIIRAWNWLLDCFYTKQFYLFEDENFVFMQYTGLKDKNGKEVYEGDVTQWKTKTGELIQREIYWINAECRFAIGEFLLTEAGANNCEIIGNIYQSPELLN